MAIARGAGTEILRAHHFEDLTGAVNTDLIIGVQHHIYTVLSVIVSCLGLSVATHYCALLIYGYDSFGGTTTEEHQIFRQIIAEQETFVWNDKFSFNGFEPSNFTGPLDNATKQDAVADQGSGVAQKLLLATSAASTTYDCNITFIDQNNA